MRDFYVFKIVICKTILDWSSNVCGACRSDLKRIWCKIYAPYLKWLKTAPRASYNIGRVTIVFTIFNTATFNITYNLVKKNANTIPIILPILLK